MEIRTLEATSLKEITSAFNEAFADYVIKFGFTEEGMAIKIKSENIVLQYSVGAFEDDRLVAFILHGYDVLDNVKTIYNAGTGVIPSFRGKAIVAALYKFIIPQLAQAGIFSHVLEVIEGNVKAHKIYEKIGFTIVRNLVVFKGSFNAAPASTIIIKPIDQEQWHAAQAFMDFTPAWQNNSASIQRGFEGHQLIGAFVDNKITAYAAYFPATGRVRQFAVDKSYRRQGIGKALFSYMTETSKDHQLTVASIDETNEASMQFMKALRLEWTIRLFELKLLVREALTN